MSLAPYATRIDTIKDALKGVINGTTTFNGKMSFDYIENPSASQNPFAHCSIASDSLRAIGAKETQSLITFRINIVYICDYTETAMDNLVGYIGEIVDAVEVNRKLGTSVIDTTEITNVTFGFDEGEEGLVRYSTIIITVRTLRNM